MAGTAPLGVFLALHTLTLFAALLTALPVILHLTTAQSFKLALGIAMLLSFPSLASIFPIRTVRNALAILSITVGIGAAGWVLRSWVPPATLWMTDVAISTQMQDRTPRQEPGRSQRRTDSRRWVVRVYRDQRSAGSGRADLSRLDVQR